MKRIHLFAVQLAIVAMLIDGLLPTAVAAAARSGIATPSMPLCSAGIGTPLPVKEAPPLPMRHCALCAGCAACVAGLMPSRRGDGFAARLGIGSVHSTQGSSALIVAGNIPYRAAQPRAPPAIFS